MQRNTILLHYTGASAAVLLPFAFELLSPVYGLILLVVGVIYMRRWSARPWQVLFFTAFLVWQILSVYWSDYRSAGLADVVLVLPIAVTGVLLSLFHTEDGATWMRRWAETFAWATFMAWTFIFIDSVTSYGWVNYKSFDLGGRLGLHFQSLYLIIAALILERKIWRKTFKLSTLRAVAVLWLLFGVIVLSARIHLMVVPILILLRFTELAWRNKEHRRLLVRTATALVILMGSLVAVLPGPRGRLIDLRNELRSIDGRVNGKQTNHRVFLWKYGLQVMQSSPWIGVGNGAGEEYLHEKLKTCKATFYRGKQPYFLHEFKYDFHNIYLQSWAEGGLIAVLLLILILGWGLWFSHGAIRYAWITIVFSGMTESLLDKQAGALIITFLVALTAVGSRARTNLSGTVEGL